MRYDIYGPDNEADLRAMAKAQLHQGGHTCDRPEHDDLATLALAVLKQNAIALRREAARRKREVTRALLVAYAAGGLTGAALVMWVLR